MNQTFTETEYEAVRGAGSGFFEQTRGFLEVSGAEAEMFLNGLITNDVKKLKENSWMLAAFPNAQGRLLALVRVWRKDGKFYFDTEETTAEAVLKNLERFTFAGDFFVKNLTEEFSCVAVRGNSAQSLKLKTENFIFPTDENEVAENDFNGGKVFVIQAVRAAGFDVFVPKTQAESFIKELKTLGLTAIGEETREILRIENGELLYGVDMDEATVVLETGLDEAVSFNKGCYIGQEIIARIHFRGHVAKKMTGLIFEDETAQIKANDEIKSVEGKNAGRITSITYSPALKKIIALGFIRYDYLAEETELKVNDFAAKVKNLPFMP